MPFTSVTVNVTVLLPVLLQLKLVFDKAMLAIPQLSVDPLLTMLVVSVAFPVASRFSAIGELTTTVGLVLSAIVMVALAVALFPFTSVTVSTTLFAPTLLQLKLVLDKPNVPILQLSLEPLFTCEAATLTVPDPFKYKVKFCAMAVGLVVSRTNTLKLAECVLDEASVTVSDTVLLPISLQLNELLLIDLVEIEQLSVLALSAAAAVMLAAPEAFKYTIKFFGRATGLVLSFTFTVVVAV